MFTELPGHVMMHCSVDLSPDHVIELLINYS